MKPIRTLIGYVRSSLARKLVLAIVLVQAALTVLLLWQLIVTEQGDLEDQLVDRAQGVAAMLATSGSSWVIAEDTEGLAELMTAASDTKALRYAMFVDRKGRVLAHTDRRFVGRHLADPASRALIAAAGAPRVVARTEYSVDVAAPVLVDSRPVGWARVNVSFTGIKARQRALAIGAISFGLLALGVGLLVALLAARGVTRRLRDLELVSSRFREGERNVRIAVRGCDEVAGAATGINAMLDAVTATERSLRDVQRVAQLGSWRYEPSQRTMVWSEAVYDLFGYDPRGPAPTFEEMLAALPAEQQAMLREMAENPDAHPASGFNLTVRRHDGTERICWVEIRTDAMPGTGRRVIEGICQDVTEREAAAAQLRQAQKMEAVGQLTGGVAHDFNNLLAIAIGNLDLAQEELSEDSLAREAVDDALAAMLRGSELTRQLLAFSRNQPLAPQSIDLNALICGFEALWRRTVGAEIAVSTSLASDLWQIKADRSQLESSILNLVINARDAMAEGGILTVETGNVRIYHVDASDAFADLDPGDYGVVSVSDSGQGMSRETVARVFEPFFTTKAVGKGSGLGLSMVYGFVKQSGGHVKIYSEPGEGTTVRLYLPRDIPAHSAQTLGPPPPVPKGSNETILLVEDEEGVRRIAERQLRELGYRVRVAASGPRALELLDDEVDLLLTDIIMPDGMNGIQLAERARARFPALKVLYTSGFTHSAALGEGRAHALLSKPYRKADLAEKVQEVLDAAMQPAAA